MSLSQSNLSSTPVDFVVATTFQAMNSTMFQMLGTTEYPPFFLCWNQDEPGQTPYSVSMSDVMASCAPGCTAGCGTNGTNPFEVDSWNSGTDPVTPDITNLMNSSFYCGMQIQLGLPGGMNFPGAPEQPFTSTLPYVVSVNDADAGTITFNLLCSTFQVVAAEFGDDGSYSFTNVHQPYGTAWIIQTTVPLAALNPSFAPSDVQNAINNLGPGAFSIQQIFADMDNAASQQSINFIGSLPDDIQQYVTAQLIDQYYQFAQLNNLPVFGYAISGAPAASTSPFSIGDMQLSINEYSDSDGNMLSTLQYLCTSPGNATVPPNYSGISWNWIENEGSATPDGVVALSQGTVLNYILNYLKDYIESFCLQPVVELLSGPIYAIGLTQGNVPEVVVNPTSSTMPGLVCSVIWDPSSAYAELDAKEYSLRGASRYNMYIQFIENQIIISQNYWVYFDFWDFWDGNAAGSVYSTVIVDTYTLAVGPGGALVATVSTQTTYNQPGQSSFTDSDEVLTQSMIVSPFSNGGADISSIPDITSTNLPSDAFSFLQKLAFPGGQTFNFADVTFSENLDLISNIVYQAP